MNKKYSFFLFLSMIFSLVLISGCSSKDPAVPPYNNFEQPQSQVPLNTALGAGAGAAVGAIVSPGGAAIGALTGGAVGGASKAIWTMNDESAKNLIKKISNEHIQVIQDGDTITLLVPTDIYYLSDSYEFDDVFHKGLVHIAQLAIKTSTNQTIYVAGFSDGDVGSRIAQQRLSEQRAQQMADFLWANGVPLRRLSVRGYGDRFDIADNFLIHGAAMNRRVELQWRVCP